MDRNAGPTSAPRVDAAANSARARDHQQLLHPVQMATGVYYDQGRLPPMQQQQYRQSYQPQQQQPGAMNQRFSNAFMNPPVNNGQPPVEQQRAYRQSSYAPPPPAPRQQQLQPPPTQPVRYSQPPQPSSTTRVERPPRQASMLLDPQQQKMQMQQYHYEQQQQRRMQAQPQQQQTTLRPPDDRFFSSVPMASDLSSSSIATNSVASTSASPQPSDERRSKLPPPKRPTAPLCGPFDMDDWTITDSTLPSCVSPAVFLLWQTSPLTGRDAFETVFVDAQTRRVAFVAREYVRGADGVLRRGGVEDDETRDLSSSQWHESDGEQGSPVERLEWLLLSVPSARERERGSDQLGKVGLVTNENLYLPAGKVVRWKKFYKKSFFADEKEEPTWQGIGGTKYRWVVQPGQASMCHLIDHRTKEVIVTVRERSEKPTQIVISALAQPSLQPVLLTLLHRTFTIAEKARNKDRQAWEDEEVVRW